MTRTKWMRLIVRDPADILRWAGAQQVRHLSEFRHRVIAGREIVSFRLTPHYAIRIGTREIIVVAHVRGYPWHELRATWRRLRLRLAAALVCPAPQDALSVPALPRPGAPIPFPALRRPAP